MGEALVHYLEEEIEYRVADQVYRLEAGDCFLIEATQLYAYHNVSQVPAIVPVIFQAAQVHGLARQHHKKRMWTLASALLIAGALVASIGFAYAAGNIWADLRRGCFGVLAGNARWGIRLVVLGSLLSTIGLALGGLRDVVGLLAE